MVDKKKAPAKKAKKKAVRKKAGKKTKATVTTEPEQTSAPKAEQSSEEVPIELRSGRQFPLASVWHNLLSDKRVTDGAMVTYVSLDHILGGVPSRKSSLVALAELRSVTKADISEHLDQLKACGLVEVLPHPNRPDIYNIVLVRSPFAKK